MEQEHGFWILDDKKLIPVGDDILRWAEFFQQHEKRIVGFSTLADDVEVSTVFIGIPALVYRQGPPLLFETMIIGGPLDRERDRYATWDEAVSGHEKMVKRAEAMT